MINFRTESGAVYQISGALIRRVHLNPVYVKRGDEEWQRLVMEPNVKYGQRAVLIMESLSGYGPDDYGVENGGTTTRTTTPVVAIWED